MYNCESPSFTSPPGKVLFSLTKAFRTSNAVKPVAINRSRFKSTRISRYTPPQTSIAPTPGTCSIRLLMSRSKIRVNSSSGRIDSAPKITIGESFGSNLRTRGASASSGKLRRTRSNAARTSLAASSIFVFREKLRLTQLFPSDEFDVIRSRFATPDNAFSS